MSPVYLRRVPGLRNPCDSPLWEPYTTQEYYLSLGPFQSRSRFGVVHRDVRLRPVHPRPRLRFIVPSSATVDTFLLTTRSLEETFEDLY